MGRRLRRHTLRILEVADSWLHQHAYRVEWAWQWLCDRYERRLDQL